jgi:3-deoxy-D-arabino-heptulosonate 7-phosphate (DAHP) synthase
MKFMEMYRQKHNILSTKVTTATELPEATYDHIKAFIKQSFGADAEIEVHIDPEHAWSDGAQSLTPEQFAATMEKLRSMAEFVGRPVDITE